MTDIVILAAGKGTRMRSALPKVLHRLAGTPFLQHVINTAERLAEPNINIVVGRGAEEVKAGVNGDTDLSFITQTEQLGTGHAVQQALPKLSEEASVLILYGDVPLISESTLLSMLAKVSDTSMALLTYELANPSGYGRIVRNAQHAVTAIVEQKDARPEQLAISEINTGVMAAKGKHLHTWLPALSNNNAQGEYYLTDIIAMAVADDIEVKTVSADSEIEITGVNSRVQQAQLERSYQLSQAQTLLENGLSLLDPARFDLRGQLAHGEDCEIDINCVFEGKNSIGNNVTIGANCILKNAKVGDHVVIKPNSIVEDSELGNECVIGPYARLRPGSKLAEKAKIGNFVETKKALIGKGSKVNHLSYVGDAELGEEVNVGAGTITCNYDGVNKSLTQIDDGAFIGSNSSLVAPVSVGKNATVGAGSVVTKSSSENQLVLTRAKQRNVDGWQRPKKR